jgi:parvulin-like peptidyl-prolyl isomerase
MSHLIEKKKFLLLLFAASAALILACSDKGREIVAEWDGQQITLAEFRIAYLDVIKKPNMFDSPQQREKFLDELIAARMLAREAERRGYFDDEKLRYQIDAYHNKALRQAHFNTVIRPKFSFTEEDVQEAYQFLQEQRRISHLFAPTRAGIDSIAALLKQGANFEAIAATLFSDTTLARHGGDLGWVYWDQLDYDLAMTAFRAPAGVPSAPVRSQYGWHIIKVTDFKKNPMITRAEYAAHRQKAKARLEYMLDDKYGRDYVSSMMEKAEITVNPDVALFVRNKLKNVFTRHPAELDQAAEQQLTEEEVRQVELNLWDVRREPLATINGNKYTVGEFIGALTYVPYSITYNNFKQAMNYAFRDHLLEQEALERRLDRNEQVIDKSTLYKEFLLQLQLRRDLVAAVGVSDAEVRDYYEHHRESFANAVFGQYESIVRDIVRREKRAQAVPDFLRRLPENREVKKYPEIIHRFYDDVTNKKI